MDVMEAIFNRRTVGKVKPDPIEEEKLNQLLEAATWAPNHYHTEPWRFFVLSGEGRRPLGRMLVEIAKEEMDVGDSSKQTEKLAKIEQKPFRAPVIIAVAVTPSDKQKVLEIEEISATSAAIQNMLLAVHALGLAAIWRTGAPAFHPKMKQLFGLRDQDNILGFIYIGYAQKEASKSKRIPYEQKTMWIDSDRNYYE